MAEATRDCRAAHGFQGLNLDRIAFATRALESGGCVTLQSRPEDRVLLGRVGVSDVVAGEGTAHTA